MTDTALLKYIKDKGGPFTIGDAASATGLSLDVVRQSLDNYIRRYKSALAATDKGELVYNFGAKLVRRTTKPLGKRLKQAMQRLWRWFSSFYKVLISLILIAYFIAFVILIIAALIAALGAASKNNDSDNDTDLSAFGDILGGIIRSLFRVWTHQSTSYSASDQWGYDYRRYEPRKTHWPVRKSSLPKDEDKKQKKKKSFIAAAHNFALGVPRVPTEPLHDQRELASFLRQHQAVTCAAEIQALSGWHRQQADEFFTDAIVKFEGTSEITENGTLYAQFDQLATGLDKGNYPVTYYWDEYIAPYEVTGNTGSRNVIIAMMNTFNLVLAMVVLDGGFNLQDTLFVRISLGWFPLVFSSTFFLFPLIRLFWAKHKEQSRHRHNIRRRLMRTIFDNRREGLSLEELTKAANTANVMERLSKERVKELAVELARDMGGDSTLTETGDIRFDFHNLVQELEDIQRIRSGHELDSSPGNVVPVV